MKGFPSSIISFDLMLVSFDPCWLQLDLSTSRILSRDWRTAGSRCGPRK